MTNHVSDVTSNGVCTIRLDRPEKLNAMSVDMWNAVQDSVRRGADADDVRVVVITGTGRFFCSGDDIGPLAHVEDERDIREIADSLLECLNEIETASVPVVARANGSAFGGGFELLVAADITVVPDSATFKLPEVQIGAFPFYAAKRLGRIIGRQRTMDLALAGREITADQAVDWGLFARSVSEDELDGAVDEIISSLKRASPASLATTKSWVNASLSFPGEDAGMRSGLGYLFAGPDAKEGAQAFLEGRVPEFTEDQ